MRSLIRIGSVFVVASALLGSCRREEQPAPDTTGGPGSGGEGDSAPGVTDDTITIGTTPYTQFGNPEPFDVVITLQTPFTYNASLGQDLIVQIRTLGPNAPFGFGVDSKSTPTGGNGGAAIGNLTNASATTSNFTYNEFVPVIRIGYSTLQALWQVNQTNATIDIDGIGPNDAAYVETISAPVGVTSSFCTPPPYTQRATTATMLNQAREPARSRHHLGGADRRPVPRRRTCVSRLTNAPASPGGATGAVTVVTAYRTDARPR